MNEEFRKRLEAELRKEFTIKIIVQTVLEYYKYPKYLVMAKGGSQNVKYVRGMICYLARSIYGIDINFITKMTKFTKHVVDYGNERIRETLNELKVQTDVNNLRQILVKKING